MTGQQFEGQFGIERETLRIDRNGRIAKTIHPFQHPHLERDFCENQLEIITPPCRSIPEAMQALEKLDSEARTILQKQNETLWKYSNPPVVESEEEIPVAFFREASRSGKNNYRQYLAQKYGKRLMLFSGIHFNLSFSDAYLEKLRSDTMPDVSFQTYKDGFYLRLTKQVLMHSWLLVLLTSASPLCEPTQQGDAKLSEFASVRNGKNGYWNDFIPELDYSDIMHYVKSVERYVEKGILYSAAELYLPVRLKPKGINQIHALLDGVSHVELRMFDLNPLEPLGIAEKDLQFAHLLLVYLSEREDFDLTPELQAQAVRSHQAAASLRTEDISVNGKNILTAAQEILNAMADAFAEDTEALELIAYEQQKLTNRLCEQICGLPEQELYRQIIS